MALVFFSGIRCTGLWCVPHTDELVWLRILKLGPMLVLRVRNQSLLTGLLLRTDVSISRHGTQPVPGTSSRFVTPRKARRRTLPNLGSDSYLRCALSGGASCYTTAGQNQRFVTGLGPTLATYPVTKGM